MRILVVSQYFWPEGFRINELVRKLVEKGHALTVLTGKPNYPSGKLFLGYKKAGIRREPYAGADVVRIPLVPRGRGSAFSLIVNYLSFIVSGFLIAPLALRPKRFDVVFVYALSPLLQTLPAIFLAWVHHAPLVVLVQDLWPESLSATGFVQNKAVLGLVNRLVRYIYRHTDLILVQSEAFIAPISRFVQDKKKIHYYPNSAEEIFCMPQKRTGASALVDSIRKQFSIVFAGNLGTAQALDTIIDAAEKLKGHEDIRFFIVGSGSCSSWLEEQIARRHLVNVELPGRLPLEDMPVLFSAAAALLVSLKSDPILTYTIPSKIQSYLAVGRPVIASLNGEGARVIELAGAGFTCPAQDADALAATIMRLYALPPEEQKRLGEHGHRYFMEHFDPDKLVCKLIDYFEIVQRAHKGKTP
ncbi:MAG: glycosyltransferase family 4 protein [Alphaproteobacteria bacterium]|nr:glycosyltransferase family 4 protein [Alphaproteobacteria bacterium]